ncbi:MAG: hypothetical protein A3H97_02240 [Acidobacteria bacterium RIFCSPLOWO2_02_FULL_65_29]|nr:MAG: hypothetical protein A3H97_02240 [Acidobacteria bacterium RIFCSPLOWO2_02_FULL_65_29]
MFSNRLAFAVLAAACVTAAASGAYLATRQNRQSPAAVATLSPVEAPPPSTAAKAVQETEAVIQDAPRAAEPAPAVVAAEPTRVPSPAPAPAARRREEPSRRTAQSTRPAETTSTRNSQLPTLERGWPNAPSAPAPEPSVPAVVEPPAPPPAAPVEQPSAPEPPREPEPPARLFEELVVAADSVVGLRVDSPVTSETARVEDRVEARVVRDVRAGEAVAIPAGSRMLGSVTVVERGGKLKAVGRLGIRFHTLVLADGTRLPITTETITRSGESQGQASAAKIGGGAVVGAILGAIAGGAKGAAIGAAAGSGAGAASVATGDRSEATLRAGEEVTARILSPITVTIEK